MKHVNKIDYLVNFETLQELVGKISDTEIKNKIISELSSLKEEIDLKIRLEQHQQELVSKINNLVNFETIQELIEEISDTEIKNKINRELSSLKEETDLKIKLEQHRIDGLERKSKIWLSFLQRESAASIIGGLVLLMLTLALIGGMIFGRESQILSNGFLVILGYFFGQSSVKNNKDGGSDSM